MQNIINTDSPTFSGSDTPISISKTSPFASSSIQEKFFSIKDSNLYYCPNTNNYNFYRLFLSGSLSHQEILRNHSALHFGKTTKALTFPNDVKHTQTQTHTDTHTHTHTKQERINCKRKKSCVLPTPQVQKILFSPLQEYCGFFFLFYILNPQIWIIKIINSLFLILVFFRVVSSLFKKEDRQPLLLPVEAYILTEIIIPLSNFNIMISLISQ